MLAILLLLSVPMAAAQGGAKPVGMILEVQGTVNIQRGQTNTRALPADFVLAGDRITTTAAGKVTFSFCPQSQRYSLSADSTVSIEAAAVQQSKGAPASKTAAAGCTLPQVALGKRDIDHIGAMSSREAPPPIPLYVGGDISVTRPKFMWAPVTSATEYELILKATGNARALWTWKHPGEASEVQMPDTEAELRPGAYSWELTARAGGKIVGQQTAKLEVKPKSDLPSASGGGLSQLEIAAAFENDGYYSEAATIYRTLRSQNANDPRFTRELLWLYYEAGLFEASNVELPNATAQK